MWHVLTSSPASPFSSRRPVVCEWGRGLQALRHIYVLAAVPLKKSGASCCV